MFCHTQDKYLVRLMDVETDMPICTHYTNNIFEEFKLYHYMVSNGIETELRIAEEDNENYKDKVFFIKDVYIQFGGECGLNTLDVYVEAM